MIGVGGRYAFSVRFAMVETQGGGSKGRGTYIMGIFEHHTSPVMKSARMIGP